METTPEIPKIEIEQETLKDLNTTRKWTMFLSILGFIGIGVLVIAGLFAGAFLSVFNTGDADLGYPEWLVFIIVLAFAAIYFFPVLYLFRFSKHTSAAVKTLDKNELHKAFKNLRRYYVFIGILIIVVLALYLIIIVAAGASVALFKGLG
jgi:MFS family permease